MSELSDHLVVAADGSEAVVALRPDAFRDRTRAPGWLLRALGICERPRGGWWLVPRSGGPARRLYLVRAATAGAGGAPFDPREERLRKERLLLEKLNDESDYVRVEFLDVLDGSEPDHYRVTFICKGISGIDANRRPIYSNLHRVDIKCGDDFPSAVPGLRWLTDIWHPNIHHAGKGVCVNKGEWLAGMGLDDLCRMMFEMVQYKNYHAESTPPYPLDGEVARWVLDYAEPNNIVNKHRRISVDNKPFTRPTTTRFIRDVSAARPEPHAPPRVRVAPSAPSLPGPRSSGAVRLVGSSAPQRAAGTPQTIKIRKS
ncbi:MAG TPA: ubiquitin-conjugating enzyme E2 [Pyrinomonadaceae bacterium]|nr:ubiquitin-conjugating enzyme E2 [Pyrinomonadaceae bacterium]